MVFEEIKAARQFELDRLLAENELDRRVFHRVFPSAQNPVYLELEGQRYTLRDISGGGLSFFAATLFYPGWIHPGRIILPAQEKPHAVNILIIEMDSRNLVRCRFDKPDSIFVASVSSYVRQRQKELLEMSLKVSAD